MPSYAVVNDTTVNESDYQDYVLKATCGGSLLGSEYFLTAKHCIEGNTGSTGVMEYGQTISNATTDSVGYTIVITGEDSGLASDWVAKADAHHSALQAADPGISGYALSEPYVSSDWILLKLDRKVGQSTGAILSPLYDFDTNVQHIPLDTTITFRGYGLDDSGNTPEFMQTSQFKTRSSWHQGRTAGDGFGDVYDA